MTHRSAPRARVLMIQGTASHAGKSTLAAALCRLFARDGWRVAPFKAQNISLNAAVTRGGGEIGVAQAVQARAAGVEPAVEMNPVLVKPAPSGRTQVIVLGRAAASPPTRAAVWRAIARSLDALRARADLIVIEGAGSPAEVNLRRSDLTNMRIARYAGAPVLIAGDIDRGGVFAALAGTMALLDRTERALVRGFVINKFRGDAAALRPALEDLQRRTRRPVLGVVPYAPAWRLPEEDAVALDWAGGARRDGTRDAGAQPPGEPWLEVAIVHLPYISNFDEFDGLEQEAGVRVRYVRPGQRLGRPDLVVLPGSKSTVADLEVLRRSGLAEAVRDAAFAGVPVLGICGGYQMLGRRIDDPERVESDRPVVEGLGLLPVATTFGRTKRTARVRVRVGASPPHRGGLVGAWPEIEAQGYEIHMGRSAPGGPAWVRILARSGRRCDEPGGAASPDGMICGTSVHGLFENPAVRHALLEGLWARRGVAAAAARWRGERRSVTLDERLDGLADLVARHLDLDRVRAIAGLRRR
ncbi:MAG TPA: cobyric acid synthase [bacterium]|nr:cobyric acid synthase [bacterium]